MSKQLYRLLGSKVGKYSCVSLNSYDHVLAGEGGEVWEYGPQAYRACVALPAGGEKVVKFGPEKLRYWVNKLQISLNPENQLFWANNPNAKHAKRDI